jgi:hypothetical protein
MSHAGVQELTKRCIILLGKGIFYCEQVFKVAIQRLDDRSPVAGQNARPDFRTGCSDACRGVKTAGG